MLNLNEGDKAFIINSHSSRAHLAQVLSNDGVVIAVQNLDKNSGPLLFDARTGEAEHDLGYDRLSGARPARLRPTTDLEAQALRERTEEIARSTAHYDAVRDAAAEHKRHPSGATFAALMDAVHDWGAAGAIAVDEDDD